MQNALWFITIVALPVNNRQEPTIVISQGFSASFRIFGRLRLYCKFVYPVLGIMAASRVMLKAFNAKEMLVIPARSLAASKRSLKGQLYAKNHRTFTSSAHPRASISPRQNPHSGSGSEEAGKAGWKMPTALALSAFTGFGTYFLGIKGHERNPSLEASTVLNLEDIPVYGTSKDMQNVRILLLWNENRIIPDIKCSFA